ncbi:hypothetical protein SBY92_004468 [Candida maltosa Xu316]
MLPVPSPPPPQPHIPQLSVSPPSHQTSPLLVSPPPQAQAKQPTIPSIQVPPTQSPQSLNSPNATAPQTQHLISAAEQHLQERQQHQQHQLDAAARLQQLRHSQPPLPKLPPSEIPHTHSPPHLSAGSSPQQLPTLIATSNPHPLASPAPIPSPISKPKRKNRPGKKFGAKKRSWVWTWFKQDPNDPNLAECDYCGKTILRLPSDKGSPKKLNEHLKTHKININSINYARDSSNNTSPTASNNNNNGSGASLNDEMRDDSDVSDDSRSIATEDNHKFISDDLDTSPFTPMKFRTHLLKFLTENKLPINVIKSESFKQLIYDLRPESVSDLMELTGMYSSLIEVSRYGINSNNSNKNDAMIPDEAALQAGSLAVPNGNLENNNNKDGGNLIEKNGDN